MPSRVLVPVDGSDPGFEALAYSFQLFPDLPHETLYVIDPGEDTHADPGSDDWERRARRRARRVHRQAQEIAGRVGRSLETNTVVGRPQRHILQYANQEGIDHVCLGGTGKARIPDLRLGSIAYAVADRSNCPVTIVPDDHAPTGSKGPDNVLVGIDGNKSAIQALEFAIKTMGSATIFGLTVSTRLSRSAVEDIRGTYVEEILDDAREVAEDHLDDARSRARDLGSELQTDVVFGTPSQRLIDIAVGDGYDHIILGAGNRRRGRTPLGRVAEAVLRRSPIPVTVVR